MNTRTLYIAMLMVLLCLFGVAFVEQKTSSGRDVTNESVPSTLINTLGTSVANTPSQVADTNHTATVLESLDGQAATATVSGEQGEVVLVVDGDTIDVRIAGKVERVRYIGIDTPETVHPNKPVQCFGNEASAKNKELVLGKTVTLVRDVTDRDKYGRLLRYVYVGDMMVNEALVRGGYASVYTYPPDVQYDARFREAQAVAREQGAGLWGAVCDSYTPIPIRIPIPADGCTIKGNVSAKGDKIYHAPGCKSYEKTTINEGQGERWFCTDQEALDAGWRKALNC